MRQKLTACAVLCLLECILQASAKDRLDFSGSCHFLCTLFSLTFSLWPPCYTTCGVRESPPSRTLLCNPPTPLSPGPCSLFFLSFHLPFPWPQRSESSQRLSYLFPRTHCSSLHLFTSSLPWSLHHVSPLKHAKTPAPLCFLCMCISALMHECLGAVSQGKWRKTVMVRMGMKVQRTREQQTFKSFELQFHPGCVFLCCKRNKECGALDFHILTSTLILNSVLPRGHERSVLSLRLYNYHKC